MLKKCERRKALRQIKNISNINLAKKQCPQLFKLPYIGVSNQLSKQNGQYNHNGLKNHKQAQRTLNIQKFYLKFLHQKTAPKMKRFKERIQKRRLKKQIKHFKYRYKRRGRHHRKIIEIPYSPLPDLKNNESMFQFNDLRRIQNYYEFGNEDKEVYKKGRKTKGKKKDG